MRIKVAIMFNECPNDYNIELTKFKGSITIFLHKERKGNRNHPMVSLNDKTWSNIHFIKNINVKKVDDNQTIVTQDNFFPQLNRMDKISSNQVHNVNEDIFP